MVVQLVGGTTGSLDMVDQCGAAGRRGWGTTVLVETVERCRQQSSGERQLHGPGDHHQHGGGGGTAPRPRGKTGQHHHHQQQQQHIKKPLNAFMMYMKDMRQTVIEESTLKESAAINQILGRRVSKPLPLHPSLPHLDNILPAPYPLAVLGVRGTPTSHPLSVWSCISFCLVWGTLLSSLTPSSRRHYYPPGDTFGSPILSELLLTENAASLTPVAVSGKPHVQFFPAFFGLKLASGRAP